MGEARRKKLAALALQNNNGASAHIHTAPAAAPVPAPTFPGSILRNPAQGSLFGSLPPQVKPAAAAPAKPQPVAAAPETPTAPVAAVAPLPAPVDPEPVKAAAPATTANEAPAPVEAAAASEPAPVAEKTVTAVAPPEATVVTPPAGPTIADIEIDEEEAKQLEAQNAFRDLDRVARDLAMSVRAQDRWPLTVQIRKAFQNGITLADLADKNGEGAGKAYRELMKALDDDEDIWEVSAGCMRRAAARNQTVGDLHDRFIAACHAEWRGYMRNTMTFGLSKAQSEQIGVYREFCAQTGGEFPEELLADRAAA